MPLYCVIDLGSNSIRRVIYDIRKTSIDAKTVTYRYTSVANDKVMAGLAAHVVDGVFQRSGIDKAVSVLNRHLKRSEQLACDRVEIFATAVLRNCDNSAEAVATIEERIGTRINLLSGREEAHLGFVGASLGNDLTQGTLIDIGGGSTELTQVVDGCDQQQVSVRHGSLSTFSRYVEGIIPTVAEVQAIREGFCEALQDVMGSNAEPDGKAKVKGESKADGATTAKNEAKTNGNAKPGSQQNAVESAMLEQFASPQLYGIGGSVRAAAKILAYMDETETQQKILTHDDLRRIIAYLEKDPNAFAHTALKAAPERVHTIAPGCIIIDELFTALGGEQLEICKHGIREGYLTERML